MRQLRTDLIKASSMAVGLVLVITLLGRYVIPPYVFVTPGYSFYVSGIVDHKKIGQGYSNGELHTWHTVSVRLFDDDPINKVQGGETLAYIVTKAEWEMIEWGDAVKIELLPDVRAEVVELFPSLKLPEWKHGIDGLNIGLTANKSVYNAGEKAYFNVKISYAPDLSWWSGHPHSMNLTLLKTFPFWIFRDGKKVFSSYGDIEPQEVVIEPNEGLDFSFEWDLTGDDGKALSGGIYYVRVYFGYYTENEEITLTGTTMIEIKPNK